MGVSYQIEAEGFVYRVVDDLTISYQAIFTSALLDEITGGPVVSQPLLDTDLPKLSLRVAEGGLIAGAAYATQVFPKLSTLSYTFHVDISAPGYRDQTITVNVPVASLFPVVVPPVVLRRIPVRLQGRVVKDSDRSALSGAVIASKNGTQPLLRDTVRSAHNAGVTVQAVSFANTGPARKLIAATLGSATRLILDNNGGLAAGNLLQIGEAGSAGIYQVGSIGPDPGLVTLNIALTSTFAINTPVQQVTPSGPTGTTTLARSSDVGEGVLVLTAALSDKGISIVDGPSTEHHWLNAISDSDGYYRANGIAGVKTLELLCSSAGLTTYDQPWSPQYSDTVNVVDFRLRP